jgi:hypothetical protein
MRPRDRSLVRRLVRVRLSLSLSLSLSLTLTLTRTLILTLTLTLTPTRALTSSFIWLSRLMNAGLFAHS